VSFLLRQGGAFDSQLDAGLEDQGGGRSKSRFSVVGSLRWLTGNLSLQAAPLRIMQLLIK
jgi:hypothetical protein